MRLANVSYCSQKVVHVSGTDDKPKVKKKHKSYDSKNVENIKKYK